MWQSCSIIIIICSEQAPLCLFDSQDSSTWRYKQFREAGFSWAASRHRTSHWRWSRHLRLSYRANQERRNGAWHVPVPIVKMRRRGKADPDYVHRSSSDCFLFLFFSPFGSKYTFKLVNNITLYELGVKEESGFPLVVSNNEKYFNWMFAL